MGHPVKGFAEVDSGGNDSSRSLGRVVQVSEDEVNSSNDVVDYRAARESTKLITSNVGGDIFPYPFDK